MTDDKRRLLDLVADPCSCPRLYPRDREAITAALEEIGRLTEDLGHAFDAIRQLISAFAIEKAVPASTILNWVQLPIFATAKTREVFCRACLLDEADAVATVRKAADLDNDESVRAVLDQDQQDTAAVAERERAGEVIDPDTMDFRMGQ